MTDTRSAGPTEHPLGEAFVDLVAVMDRLRSPGGCPWDAQQTHSSLLEYLIEECYETIEAVETDDPTGLREELGDVLLQVVFHARIAQESVPGWDIDDVARGITDKLVRRHPRVFSAQVGGAQATDDGEPTDDVEPNWTALKKAEKSRASALDGIPRSMPALALAQKSWRRAHESGLTLSSPLSTEAPESPGDLGRALLALTVVAENRGWDAEAALRGAVRDLHEQIRDVEGP